MNTCHATALKFLFVGRDVSIGSDFMFFFSSPMWLTSCPCRLMEKSILSSLICHAICHYVSRPISLLFHSFGSLVCHCTNTVLPYFNVISVSGRASLPSCSSKLSQLLLALSSSIYFRICLSSSTKTLLGFWLAVWYNYRFGKNGQLCDNEVSPSIAVFLRSSGV